MADRYGDIAEKFQRHKRIKTELYAVNKNTLCQCEPSDALYLTSIPCMDFLHLSKLAFLEPVENDEFSTFIYDIDSDNFCTKVNDICGFLARSLISKEASTPYKKDQYGIFDCCLLTKVKRPEIESTIVNYGD